MKMSTSELKPFQSRNTRPAQAETMAELFQIEIEFIFYLVYFYFFYLFRVLNSM